MFLDIFWSDIVISFERGGKDLQIMYKYTNIQSSLMKTFVVCLLSHLML